MFFNEIECIFRKSGVFSYLIFCETEKNKKMFDKYVKIIHKIRFKFKTNDNLPYNPKIVQKNQKMFQFV